MDEGEVYDLCLNTVAVVAPTQEGSEGAVIKKADKMRAHLGCPTKGMNECS